MVAYNFQQRFVPDIRARVKRQTIRAKRKDGRCAKPGDALQLYSGMRTKNCFKIIDDPVCRSVHGLEIDYNSIKVDGKEIKYLEEFAKADGFVSISDFMYFFSDTHELPFKGYLIRW